MATLAQFDANRANALQSTGPRTPEGKAASSQNARKHGFYSPVATIPPEQREEYESLRDALAEDVRPVGALEVEFFGRLAVSSWHLRLVTARECELFAGPDDLWDPGSRAAATLAQVQRCRRDLERSRRQALAELRRLQTARALAQLQPEDPAPLPRSAPLANPALLRDARPPAQPRSPLPNRPSNPTAPDLHRE